MTQPVSSSRSSVRLKVAYKTPEALLGEFTRSVGQGGVTLETRKSVPTGTRFVFEMHAKGVGKPLEVVGEVDDYIDADVTQYIGFNGTSGQITTKINGTIATRSGEYTYNNETFTFAEAGVLPVEADADAEIDD